MAFIGQFLKNFFGEGSNDIRCLQVGLDASGKTTILYRMKLGEIVTTIPTIGFNVESFEIDGMNLTVWDVGGCDKIRPLYRHYFANTQVLVWVVDSNDRERLEETTYWLQQLVHEPELQDCVVLVFANKQDLPNAMRVPELQDKLGLSTIRHIPWFIQPCAAADRDTSDLIAGFTWAVRTWRSRQGVRKITPPTPSASTSSSSSSTSPSAHQPSASTKSGKAKITKDEKEKAREAEQEALFLKWLVNDVDTAAEFIAKVEAGDISSFDHRTLLRIIWSNISLFGRREAIKRIFNQLTKYYEKFPLSVRNNETWTYFWIQMVHYAMEVTRNPSGDFIGFLFMNPLLMNQRLPYGHYRKKTILSPEAVKAVVLPDKKPLPSVIPKAYIPTQHPTTAPKAIQPPVPEGVTDDYDQDDKLTEEEFLTQFEACNLHKWDHKTHVRLAWAYIMKYGRKIGSDKVFKGIENFILNSKISRKTTFHVTMTFFWVQMVDIAIMSSPKGISFEEFIKQNPQLMEGGLFLQYYKKETMLNNPTARKEFVLPDIFEFF